MPPPRPIIFDFDGVIVDSEVLANRALAECLTAAGFPTTYEDSVANYIGLRSSDSLSAAERIHGRKLPPDFLETCRTHTRALFREHLKPIPGAATFIGACAREKIAIASSSSVAGITLSLGIVGLTEAFAGRIFSAADIERGKPHPDIFLKAANGIGANPPDCIVIEDGTLGTQGAVAAGMTVIGLIAGSHCTPGHADSLRQAGAHKIAASYAEVEAILGENGHLR